jgi:hypothetical protein
MEQPSKATPKRQHGHSHAPTEGSLPRPKPIPLTAPRPTARRPRCGGVRDELRAATGLRSLRCAALGRSERPPCSVGQVAVSAGARFRHALARRSARVGAPPLTGPACEILLGRISCTAVLASGVAVDAPRILRHAGVPRSTAGRVLPARTLPRFRLRPLPQAGIGSAVSTSHAGSLPRKGLRPASTRPTGRSGSQRGGSANWSG